MHMLYLKSFILAVIASCWSMMVSAQTVKTDPRFARGATKAFGRMIVTGIPATDIAEQGFCWSESPEPTIDDFKTTKYLTNNGRIYYLDDLTPATKYYMRAYVLRKNQEVVYGDVIRFYTIPKGQISFNIRSSNDNAADERIRAAAQKAIDYWNDFTEMKGFNTSIGYNPGTPTAECSYGGWMSVGSNQSYQKTGTIMHEMLHGIGVIPWADTEWSGFNLRSGTSNAAGFTTGSGLWLGDRVTEVLRFWDNSTTSQLNGDYQHMWPYGINGAHEDNGSDVLYFGTSLICQALGEDGLQHTNQIFAEPYYAFDHQDTLKYYIKCEDSEFGLYDAVLVPAANKKLAWKKMTPEEALNSDSCAWYFRFSPDRQHYQIFNASTGQYISYNGSEFRLTDTATPSNAEWLQLMKGRVDVESSDLRGYWMISPASNWSPACLQAGNNGATTAATFNIANSATTQRWLILSGEELSSFSMLMMKSVVTALQDKISHIRALASVPHTEDVNGVDEALNTALSQIESELSQATNTVMVQSLIEQADAAAFAFLANATPSDMEQPFDLTYMLQNPDMDAADGWSIAPTINYSCGEFYEKAFDINQQVKNLPEGTYQFRAQGFQRPGRASECSGKTVTAFIYAGLRSTRLAHITSDAQTSKLGGNESSVGGKYFPNDMEAASIYFDKGLYENRVTSSVPHDGGQLKMGIRCSTVDSYYWCIFDNFRLCYFGSLSIDEVNGVKAPIVEQNDLHATGVYSLMGVKVADSMEEATTLSPGVYIVNGKKTIIGF